MILDIINPSRTNLKVVKWLFILLLFYYNGLVAQHVDPGVKLVHYVFNEFSPGTVKMKSGETYNQVLNYNILTSEMIFENEGKYLAIANPENVDTVTINDRKFIFLNNKFYEVLVPAKTPLLLEFTASVKEPGTSTGYGGSSNTAASTSFKTLVNAGGAYDLKLPDGFIVIPGYIYWIRKNDKLEKAGSAKQLIKIFPDKNDMINDIVRKNNINFSKREDVIILVQQIE